MSMVHALVPAAGAGRRFAGHPSKLFVEVAGRSILEWSLEALLDSTRVQSVSVALSAERLEEESRRPPRAGSAGRLRFVLGGEERQDSVGRCLAACLAADEDLVLVHDGGRPCLASEDLEQVIEAAERHGAAILGRSVTDTLKRVRGGWIEGTVDRSALFRAETPQVVRRGDLERALSRARQEGRHATDESGLLEAVGVGVRLVEAQFDNPKLTVPADLERIESILRERASSGRRSH